MGSPEPDEHTGITGPRDRRRFVYLVFYYIGLTILFPYSMLITITDFWYYKFRNTSIPYNSSADDLNEMQKNFPAYLSLSGNVPLTVLVVLTALFGYKINIKTRLLTSAVTMMICFGGVTLLAGLNTDGWQHVMFISIMVANCLYSSVNAIFQASFLGNIGRFPPRYIGCANDGMGLGATLPALINILILALGPPQQQVGLACMSFSLVVIILMILLYIPVSRTPFYIHHSGIGEVQENNTSWSEYLYVLKSSWVFVLAVFMTYATTLSLYPAVAALVKPVSQDDTDWNNIYFLPVSCFLLQAVGDWLGRSIATFSQWPGPGKMTEVGILLAMILRLGFIPLLMRCNVAPNNRSTEILFKSDAGYIAILGSFSVFGGYLGNTALMLGPKKVGLELQEVSGTILVTALVFGLGVGSLLGPSLVSLL